MCLYQQYALGKQDKYLLLNKCHIGSEFFSVRNFGIYRHYFSAL